MAAIPEKYLDLLQQKKAFANLATTMPDGSPQVTPVWFDYEGGRIRVNTAKGRVKARMEGVVILEAIITASGSVEEVKVLKSVNPLLDASAVRAVQQWRYRPATLNGRAVRVYLTVTVTFNLH